MSDSAMPARLVPTLAVRSRVRRLPAGGDGAPRPGVSDLLTLAVPARVPTEAEQAAAAWRSRVEAGQAEARAALRVPFNRPVTWDPS
ncbi:MAG TPA: hypothetical protein VGB53_15720 [Rubricoccaceae bacterium]|jgi:hypothetical protein